MLPDPQHAPAMSAQELIVHPIPCLVAAEFRQPERRAILRPRRVDGASMPEAPSTNTASRCFGNTKSGRIVTDRICTIPRRRDFARLIPHTEGTDAR